MWRTIGAIGVCAVLALFLAGCDNSPELRQDNIRPIVQINVPSPNQRVSYATTFLWTGWDEDGLIDHYEYAVDIPEEIPLDRINDPENREVSWISTVATEMAFQFATPLGDTLIGSDRLIVNPVDVGSHCLFVRAVDNEGAPSRVDFFWFTAENVHPKTIIVVSENQCTFRLPSDVVFVTGRELVVHWSGLDPDSPDPLKKPAYFEWKKIPVPSALALPRTDLSYAVNVTPGPNFPWVP